MANTLITPIVIRVARAIIYTKASAVTVATTATLVSLFTASTDIQNTVKNLVITPPSGDVVMVDLIGETASTLQPLQTFQNYLLEEKPFTLAKVSGTLLLDADEENFDLAFAGAGTATVTSTYCLYQYGGSDSGKKRVVGSLLVLFKYSTKLREILFNNLYITKLGDIKGTSADGHIERDFEGICAPENYYDSFKN